MTRQNERHLHAYLRFEVIINIYIFCIYIYTFESRRIIISLYQPLVKEAHRIAFFFFGAKREKRHALLSYSSCKILNVNRPRNWLLYFQVADAEYEKKSLFFSPFFNFISRDDFYSNFILTLFFFTFLRTQVQF